MRRQFMTPGHPGFAHARLLLPLAIIALLAALFASGMAQNAHADSPPPAGRVVVTPGAMQGWTFVDDNGAPTSPTMEMVEGPATPPIGSGSAHFVINSMLQGPFLSTNAYSGIPLSDISGLSFATYSATTTCCGRTTVLDMDVDFDGNDAYSGYQGRLNFEPNATGLVTTGLWQTWDPMTLAGWFTSHSTVYVGDTPITSPCTEVTPCTWSDIQTDFPNAQIFSGGNVGFKAGSAYSSFDGNVDDFTITANDITTTYDFEVTPPCTTVCYVNGSTGNDNNSGSSPSDAFRTIQTAVNNVQDGGTVIVAAGTYSENVQITKGVTLKGYKAGWDGRYRTPSFGGESTAGSFVITDHAGDVTIDGFTIQGEVFDNTNDNLTVIDNIFNGADASYSSQVDYDGSGSVLVTNSLFTVPSTFSTAVSVVEDAQATITDNKFTANSSSPDMIHLQQDASGEVANNTSSGGSSFLSLNSSYSGYVHDNTISGAADSAITAAGSINIIANNTISTSGAGLTLIPTPSTADTEVTGNTFSMDGMGIMLLDLGFTDYPGTLNITTNTFKSNRSAAIVLSSGGGSSLDVSGVNIHDNSIAGNAAGLIDQLTTQPDATCNWWGSSSGPSSQYTNGRGDSVSGLDLDSFAPWLTSSNLNFPCDSTAPQVTFITPANGAQYKLHQYVRPVFRCSDVGSGVASCVVTNGGSQYQLDTSTAGSHTFEVTVTDKAGNTSIMSVDYTVGSAG